MIAIRRTVFYISLLLLQHLYLHVLHVEASEESDAYIDWNVTTLEDSCYADIDYTSICDPDYILQNEQINDDIYDRYSITDAMDQISSKYYFQCKNRDGSRVTAPVQMRVMIVNTIQQGSYKENNWRERELEYVRPLFEYWFEGTNSCEGDTGGIILSIFLQDKKISLSYSRKLKKLLTRNRIYHMNKKMIPYLRKELYSEAIIAGVGVIDKFLGEGDDTGWAWVYLDWASDALIYFIIFFLGVIKIALEAFYKSPQNEAEAIPETKVETIAKDPKSDYVEEEYMNEIVAYPSTSFESLNLGYNPKYSGVFTVLEYIGLFFLLTLVVILIVSPDYDLVSANTRSMNFFVNYVLNLVSASIHFFKIRNRFR